MKLHRYYVGEQDLPHEFWMDNAQLLHQWTRVLRYTIDREVVLFNAAREERLYKIVQIDKNAIKLTMVTQMAAKVPKKDVYLCFALLKKDKTEWVLQKATELGVSHFVPLISDRTEKTGWNSERAEKIVIEAAEQCGRADIPRLREPLSPQKLIEELQGKADIHIAEQGSPLMLEGMKDDARIAVLIGPEGGWSDTEKQFFAEQNIKHLALSNFTLRAETAAVTAAGLLQCRA